MHASAPWQSKKLPPWVASKIAASGTSQHPSPPWSASDPGEARQAKRQKHESCSSTNDPAATSGNAKLAVKLHRSIVDKIHQLNSILPGAPIRLGGVALPLADLSVDAALRLLSEFEGLVEAGFVAPGGDAAAWVKKAVREHVQAAADPAVQEAELEEPPFLPEDASPNPPPWRGAMDRAVDTVVAGSQDRERHIEEAESEAEEAVSLPKTLVREVDAMNDDGVFSTPLQLAACSCSLARLHQTRLMFEVLKSLPDDAYSSSDPAAWVRRAARAKLVAKGIEEPVLCVSEASCRTLEDINTSGTLKDALDRKKVDFHLGRLTAGQQAKVLDRFVAEVERNSLRDIMDPNDVLVHFCHRERSFGKGKAKAEKGKSKGKGKGKKGYKAQTWS
eukprot:TRINITY_DN11611_c0_g1_i1.p1 TRINITY_DN11611_c0_g1~~TRINITY_DN11611_c0_g1_i1.p1  ORF type:complete len:390 (-),score=85.99 TRINITY_DN11611_c0_g1_i1:473-1642(-)